MNALGWKTDVTKKVIENVLLSLALMTTQELFKEGLSALKDKFKKPEEEEKQDSEDESEKDICQEHEELNVDCNDRCLG